MPATAVLFTAALVLAGCTSGTDAARQFPTGPASSTAVTTTAPSAPAHPQVTLAVVGDLMLGRTVGDRILADGPRAPLEAVQPLLAGADLTIGTLETAIGTAGTPEAKAYTFQAPPESIATLAYGGFDVLTLANNHSLDFGEAGLAETVDLLDDAGIAHVGAGVDAGAAHAPAVLERAGLSLAFLAYADVPDEYAGYPMSDWAAGDSSPGIAWADPEQISADVAGLTSEHDHVVVLLHSGTEGSDQVDDAQRRAADAALDAGATLVLGSHPHVLQAIEQDDGRLVAWSLGNFVFDGFEGYYEQRGVESVVLSITLDETGVTSFEPTPVRLVDGFPRPMDAAEGERLLERLASLPTAGLDR